MKHLKIFENFDKKSYYEFDAIKFYNDFKKIFNEEKKNYSDFSGKFFNFLDTFLYPNWKNDIPLDDIVNGIIKDIIQDKSVAFYDLAEDVHSGKVRKVKFFYSLFYKEFNYSIDLGGLSKYGYPEEKENYTVVKYIYPIRIYNSEPTKIEKLVDFYMTRNKFNI